MTAGRLNLARIAVVVATLAAALASSIAFGAPAERLAPRALESFPSTATLGPVSVALGPGRLAVAKGTSFRFNASVESSKPLSFLQSRLRLLRSDGVLVYQKTFIKQSLEPTTVVFTWEREIGDIGLDAGIYPVQLGIDVERAGETSRAVIPAGLYVYDPARKQLPVSIVARISAQPLTDPQGRFVSDPSRFTRARDDARYLADWVLNDANAKLTVALSPVMVREWLRIASGYQLMGAEGAIDVPPTDAVPLEYAATLDALRRAIATGRLEVLSEGYSDPDLFEIAGADLLDDVGRQYEYGQAALIEALSTTPSAGTAPPRGVPEAALPRLAQSGMKYVVVPDAQTKREGGAAAAGAYKAADSPLIALVADGAVSRAIASSSTVEALDTLFAHSLAQPSTPATLPVLVDLGPAATDARHLVATAQTLGSSPWATLVTGSESAGTPKRRVALKGHKPDKDAPATYWSRVSDSRELAEALIAALPAADEEGARAVRQSLVAAGSAWAGLDGEWGPATTGLAFAVSAIDSANDVFSHLKLAASRITLAGSKGTLPVTVANGTERRLHVVLVVSPGRGVQLEGPARREVDLDPGDNFIEIPVALGNAIAGDIEVELAAGEATLAKTTVRVQASYLDRLVVGGGALALLAGLLFFIIRRAREVETADEELIGPGQLTLDIADDETPADGATTTASNQPSSQEEHAEDS